MGMSKSVSSFITGVEAGYWNPAGILSVQDYEFSAMHNSLYSGIGSYNYFGAALPIEQNEVAFAVSIIRLGVDNILNTTNLIDSNGNVNYNNITTFSSADIAAIVSLAKRFPNLNLDVGVNGKIIRRNIGDFAIGHGFGFDIGAKYQYKNLKIGLVFKDVTTTFTAWNVDDEIFEDIANAQYDDNENDENRNQEAPESIEITLPKFQLGLSYFTKLNNNYSLLSSLDLIGRFSETNDIVSTSFASFSPNLGFEVGYKDKTFLRLGVGNLQTEVDFDNSENVSFEPNLGIGFKLNMVEINYALTNVGALSGVNFSNIFSVTVKLNKIR